MYRKTIFGCCYYRRRIRKIKEARNNKQLAQQGVMSTVQKSLENNGGAHRFGFNMTSSTGGTGPRIRSGAI